MSNQFNQKHTNENLNFNLILGIGQECSAILNLIEKYLSSTTSPYLSPNTLLSINGDSTILSTNIIDFQARYNDIMEIYAYIKKADCILIIYDQLDNKTVSILTKLSLLNDSIILFTHREEQNENHSMLHLNNLLKIGLLSSKDNPISYLNTAYAIISIVNTLNKKTITSINFSDLYQMLSNSTSSYLEVAVQQDNESIEELIVQVLLNTKIYLSQAGFIALFISADKNFSLGTLHSVWDIISIPLLNNCANCFISLDLVENLPQEVNYVGILAVTR